MLANARRREASVMDRFDPRWADDRGSVRSADRDWGSQTSGLPKCRLANARPDTVFRYRSKCPAVVASGCRRTVVSPCAWRRRFRDITNVREIQPDVRAVAPHVAVEATWRREAVRRNVRPPSCPPSWLRHYGEAPRRGYEMQFGGAVRLRDAFGTDARSGIATARQTSRKDSRTWAAKPP